MTQRRVKTNLSVAAVIVGVVVLGGCHRAGQTPEPQSAPGTSPFRPPYLASAPATPDPSSEWTCSRWLYADDSDRHTWLVGKLRLLRKLDDLPTATPREVNDFANSITAKCMTSKTDENLAVVASDIYVASRQTSSG